MRPAAATMQHWRRIASVSSLGIRTGVLCTAGVLVVSLQMSSKSSGGTDSTTTTSFGLILTLVCTGGQAFYYVAYKRQMLVCSKTAAAGEVSQLGSLLVLGLIGWANLLVLW